eukprot:m.471487 g.471487  ORF g.471487 m.471487 type:complete len:1047 (+) comp20377_c1_seq1:406-3546(+)
MMASGSPVFDPSSSAGVCGAGSGMASPLGAGKGPIWGEVLTALAGALNPDPAVRRTAEGRLDELRLSSAEFGVVLARSLCDGTVDVNLQQLAAVVLRQYVKVHWAPIPDDDGRTAPEVPPQAKGAIREALLPALASPNSRMRCLVAFACASIAYNDWPEQWPELVPMLVQGLYGGDPNVAHGAMRVLVEFIGCLSHRHLPEMLPALLPELHKIVMDEQGRDLRSRSRAIELFSGLIEAVTLYRDVEEQVEALEQAYVIPAVPHWLKLFVDLLALPNGPGMDTGFKTEVIKGLTMLAATHTRLVTRNMPGILPPVWTLMKSGVEYYNQFIVTGADVENSVDEDGRILSFENLVSAIFDFIRLLIEESRKFATKLKQHLQDFIHILVCYLPITEDQIDLWMSDVSSLIIDESENYGSPSVRQAAQDMLTALCEEYPTTVPRLVLAVSMQHMEQAKQAQAMGNPAWWKQAEAALLALQMCSEVIELTLQTQQLPGEALVWMQQTLTALVEQPTPFLQARAMVAAASFAEMLPDAAFCVHAAVGALQPDKHPAVQLAGLNSLFVLSPMLTQAGIGAPWAAHIMENLFGMVKMAPPDVICKIVETLTAVVPVHPETTLAYEAKIIPFALAVFIKFSNDPHMADAIEDLFGVCAGIPALCPRLAERAVPTLVSLIQKHNEPGYDNVAPVAVDILTKLIQQFSPPFPMAAFNDAFVAIVSVMLVSDDSSLLQNGTECLRAFLVHADQVAGWSDGKASALQYIVQVVSRLLHPEMNQHSALFVGKLLSSVILKASDALGPHISDLLLAVLNKMQHCNVPVILQTLIHVFAHMVHADMAAVLSFMEQTQSMEFVMRHWCNHHMDTVGRFDITLSIVGLSRLLMSGDPRLGTITVDGPEEYAAGLNGRIRTRAVSRRQGPPVFKQIPLLLKILELMVKEYGSAVDEEAADVEPASEDEDDGWEDEDDGSAGLDKKSPFAPAEHYHTSDIIDLGFGADVEEDEDDPDVKMHPLYSVKLKGYLEEAFRQMAQQPMFVQLAQMLTPKQQKTLSHALGTA